MENTHMKVAIVTGASGGIGLETARLFLGYGYQVINISRRKSNLENIIELQCDLAEENPFGNIKIELENILSKAELIVLVHNACTIQKDQVDHVNQEAIQKSLAISIISPALLNQLVVPFMRKDSSIIYVGSTLSEKGVPNSFTYVTVKHAVLGMMRATCQDLIGRNIHTACVCPGFTDTPMLREHVGNSEAVLKEIALGNSYQRLINPLEIAELIHWSATHPVTNGAVLHAHLGQIEK